MTTVSFELTTDAAPIAVPYDTSPVEPDELPTNVLLLPVDGDPSSPPARSPTYVFRLPVRFVKPALPPTKTFPRPSVLLRPDLFPRNVLQHPVVVFSPA